MREWQRELGTLADWLGEEHDLAVLDDWLSKHANSLSAEKATSDVRRMIRLRRNKLRKQSRLLGARLYSDKPDLVARRLSRWWKAAHELDEIEDKPTKRKNDLADVDGRGEAVERSTCVSSARQTARTPMHRGA